MTMRRSQWVWGGLAAFALATLVVSCGGTGGGGGSKGNTGEQFIRNSNNSGRLVLIVNPDEVDANKSDRIGLKAILTDSLGNPIRGVTIGFSTDLEDVTFIPGDDATNDTTGSAVTDANGQADIIAVAGSQPTSTGEIIGTGAIFAEAPPAFGLRAQVQITLLDVGFIDADVLGVVPSSIELTGPFAGGVLFFTVVGGTPPYSFNNSSSGIGTGNLGQTCLPGCTENGGVLCIGSPCQSDNDCNANASSTPAGVCLGPIKHCLASCGGSNCAGARCDTDNDCNDGSSSPANVCKDSGQSLAYILRTGCGNGVREVTDEAGITHTFQVFDSAGGTADISVTVIEDEGCDGNDFGGQTCQTVNAAFTGGTLACTNGCTLDTSGCTTASPGGPTATPGAGATFTPGGGVATQTPTPVLTPTPANTATPGIGVPSNLTLALLTNGSGDNGNGTLTTVIAATVTDSMGNPVPDGTNVFFGLTGPTQGAVINSPSATNSDPPCDVSSFESNSQGTGITVFKQPGVAHTCVTYPVGSSGAGITIQAVAGAASDSQSLNLPAPPGP
jgi:hypothetical protein